MASVNRFVFHYDFPLHCFFSPKNRFLQRNDKLALLLDYDGTLAPLTSHPNLTVMEPESEKSLQYLARHPNVYTAIISGRSAENARDKVAIENITYAGNHGFEIIYWDKTHYQHEVPADLKVNFDKLVEEMEATVGFHWKNWRAYFFTDRCFPIQQLAQNGAWVENKRHSLTYHYREVPEHLRQVYHEKARALIESYGFVANQAHLAVEAKPPVQWNKGMRRTLLNARQ